ncbi:hypothetical protein [Actinoallomurus sp. NPDC052274]|uniref:hypothetical protein n=1 Tax=Actinoallomurus sp. NPDC052274 TaxID=3155420 RepID=UPI0034178648
MRRIATATLAAGVIITTFALTTTPADAAVGFWRTVGLSGVDAFGFYNTEASKVTLTFDLKDTKKDGYSAALRFTFTGTKKQKDDVRVVALTGDQVQDKWQTVTSTRIKHMYVQECRGTWSKGKFTTKNCAPWRQHY